MEKKFINVSANENNPLWDKIIMRETPLYKRDNDLRTDFERDYTRVIYTNAYRRMKHKTQVFFLLQMTIFVQELSMLIMLNLLATPLPML